MLDRIGKILEERVCDNCLGRQFAQLLSGWTNAERGRILRSALAFAIDAKIIDYAKIEPANFRHFIFRQNKDFEKLTEKDLRCSVCNDFFLKDVPKELAQKVAKLLKNIEFKTFLVGTQLSDDLLSREEKLWERIGIEHCEPIRAEINREVGKKLEKQLKKIADFKNPDVAVLIDLRTKKIKISINPIYIFGYYKKLVRGIPQCAWGTPKKYKTSVEQIVAKPVMTATAGADHKFHGAGREDIDARCLDWRPFVLEILKPKMRTIDLKKIVKQINKTKKVAVHGLKISDMTTVRRIKEITPDKSYRALVSVDRPVKNSDLKILKKLVGMISQRTPERVLHRRAERLRRREVKAIKWKFLKPKLIELTITGTSGLYIKELISGDNGRTKPSVSELLNRKAICKQLDVVKIQKVKL